MSFRIVPLVALFVATAALADVKSVVVEATGPAGAVVRYSSPTGPDDENGRPTGNCAPASGSLFPLGTTIVQCTNGTFEVTVVDTRPPVLALPGSVEARATSSDGANVDFNAGAHDVVDGNVAVSCTPPSGSLFPIGTTTVNCSASDSRGNASAGSFAVSVTSPPAPPQPPPNDRTVEATGPDGAIVTYTSSGGEDDSDGRPTDSCSPASGSRFPLGTTRVQCASGASFHVHVVDTTAPQLHLPRSFKVVATTADGANVTFDARAHDLVDHDVAVTCTPASGSLFPIGTTRVDCSASDSRNNSASGTFDVTVTEPAPPPPPLDDITAEATGPDGAMVTFTVPGGGDDHNGRPNATCAPASGSRFPLGTTDVRCTNGSTFRVVVVDTTAPALTLPDAIAAEATEPDGAVVTFDATANDVVDGAVAVVCTPASGSTFPIGTTLVSCSASDSRGNSAGGGFAVTVTENDDDTEAPVIVSLTASPDTLAPPNGKMVAVTIAAEVTDDRDPAPLVRAFDVTSNENIDGDWTITGQLALELRSERDAQNAGRVYTIHVDAIDASGNRSTASVNVTVPHDQSSQPAVIVPVPKRRSAGRR